MIIIKIKIKIIILSILIAALMYPKTIEFIMTTGKNIILAKKLSGSTVLNYTFAANNDKTKIIFMFDDGWKSVYSEAYDLMKKFDYKGSVAIIPSLINEKEYMSYDKLAELYLKGWDLLNHSYSHKENLYDNCDFLLEDFNRARRWMKNRYIGKCSDMTVMPYGEINPYLISKLKNAGYRNVRTSDNIIRLDRDKIEYYHVTTINLLTDITVDEVKDILLHAFNTNKTTTINFILHKISNEDEGFGMTYSKEKLKQIIFFISENKEKFEVITYSSLFY